MLSTLVIITRGTYNHHDDGYTAILLANAIAAFQETATVLFIDDGVYMAVKGQDSTSLGLPNFVKYMGDLRELQGRILVFNESLKRRNLEARRLVEGVKVIDVEELCQEIKEHQVTVTF